MEPDHPNLPILRDLKRRQLANSRNTSTWFTSPDAEAASRKRSGCEGKTAYDSRSNAETVRKFFKPSTRLHVYGCPHCHKFHLGTVDLKKSRELKAV